MVNKTMYKIMIVDDEPPIVDWLYDLFLEKLVYDVEIFKAYSAVEAVKLLEKTRMDVIISDIRMPKMSGLELMDFIYERWSDTRIIFLTGYNEFDYVYKAISKEGVSYLLKTEDDDVLIKAVEQAVISIQNRNQAVLTANKQQSLLRILEYRDILSGFINQRVPLSRVKDRFASLNLRIGTDEPVYLMLAKLEYADCNCYDIYAGLQLLMNEYMSPRFDFVQIDYKENNIIWLIQPALKKTCAAECNSSANEVSRLQDIAERLIEPSNKFLGLSISFVIGEKELGWESITECISGILYNVRWFSGTDAGFVRIYKENIHSEEIYQPYADFSAKVSLLKMLLEQRKESEYAILLKEIVAALEQRPSMHDPLAIEIYSSVGLMLLSYINQNHLACQIPFKIGISQLMRYSDFPDWKEAANYLIEISKSIFSVQSEEIQAKKNSIITNVKNYIDHNLSGDLSLTAIGNALYYNPSYLSRIFKQLTGKNLLAYIVDRKLNKGAQLLQQSSEPIYAVSQAVGFENAAYFAKVFRKAYGVTPQVYRDHKNS